jgi:hypothetical protein
VSARITVRDLAEQQRLWTAIEATLQSFVESVPRAARSATDEEPR